MRPMPGLARRFRDEGGLPTPECLAYLAWADPQYLDEYEPMVALCRLENPAWNTESTLYDWGVLVRDGIDLGGEVHAALKTQIEPRLALLQEYVTGPMRDIALPSHERRESDALGIALISTKYDRFLGALGAFHSAEKYSKQGRCDYVPWHEHFLAALRSILRVCLFSAPPQGTAPDPPP